MLRIILLRPVLWAAGRFSSRPDRERIFKALSKLYDNILQHPGKKGLIIPFELYSGKFIIFSDQHKGRRNGADDFMQAFLRINPNTPAYDAEKKTLHNHLMYEWSADQKDLLQHLG